MNSFTSLSASPFFILRAQGALPADAVARQGFAKDRHEWPVAGEEDAVRSLSLSMCWVAMFRPTSVLPAPGTPVTKQTHLREFSRAERITSERAAEV